MLKPTRQQAFIRVPLVVGFSFSFLVLALLILGHRSVSPVRAIGPTIITQNISINTTWVVADSPYRIQTGTVFINNGAALTIDPGVTVEFEDGARMEIDNGQLIAIGTPTQLITFTSLNPSPTRGIWEGIQFNATPVSTIAHAVVEYGREAIRIDDSNTPFFILSSTIRYAGDFDGDPNTGGAIIGSPDDSFIHNNTVYSSETGIFLNEAGLDVVSYNRIYDIDRHCILIGQGGTGSDGNLVLNNTLHTCGGSGIRLDEVGVTGDDNQVFGNVISNTLDGGIFLERQRLSVITGNVIYDVTAGSGLIFSDFHNFINPMHSNAICVDATYEIDDRVNGSQLNAEGNWLGTNTPTLGSEVNGNVDFDPWITLNVAANPTSLPADGLSTSLVTVTMTDGAGRTVPPFARTVDLAASLGTLADTSVTLDANGVATTTLTAANIAGTAIVTATEFCNVPVTTTVQFQATDLQISKTTPLTTVAAGGLITYTIAYTNNSAVDATNVIITDTLPLSATYVSDSSNPLLASNGPVGGVITWSLPVLTGGSSGLITLTLQVDPNMPCGSSATTLTNLVDIGSDTAESSVGDNGASNTIPVSCVATSTMMITKTANLPTITPDRDIVYTIEYANTTAYTIENVTITDTLPLSTTFIGSTATANGWSEIAGSSVITWTRPNLLPFESGSFTMTVHVDAQPVCSPYSAVNLVGIGGQFVSGVTTNTATVSVVCGVDLIVTKNDDIGFGLTDLAPAVPANGVFTYTISVVNLGSDPATNVVISETIPLSTSFVGPSGPNGWFPAGGRVYTYFVGTLGPGGGTVIPLQLRADYNLPLITTTVTNEVCVASTEPDAIPSDNCDSVDTDLIGIFPPGDLIITKTIGINAITPGRDITYTIQYANLSPITISNVIITDTLPVSTTFVSSTAAADGWTEIVGSGIITWTRPELLPMQSGSFSLTVNIDSGVDCSSGTVALTNTAQIGGDLVDTVIGNNTGSATINIVCGVDLVVTKNDDIGFGLSDVAPAVPAGGVFTYTISVVNMGTDLATNVVISETIPLSTTFVGPTGPNGWFAAGGRVYTYFVGALVPGGGTVVRLQLRADYNLPPITTTVTNEVCVSSSQPDAIPVDNCDSVDTDVIGFDNQAVISKDDGGLLCVIPGQSINYTIHVTNTGTVPATGLSLHEALPNNTTFQGPVGTWTMVGPTLYTHTISAINGGATNSTPFWVRVDPGTPSTVSAITNVVTLMPQSLSFTLTTPLVHDAPDLYVVKNDNIELLPRSTLETIAHIEAKAGRSLPWLDTLKQQPRSPSAIFVSPGDTISYTVAYGNAGTFTATNVIITETLPANTQFLGPVGPGGWTQVNATTYVFTITTLPPGGGGILDFRVRVDNPFPTNTIGVTNTVTIGSDALLECDISDNISIEFTPVQGTSSSQNVYLPIVLKNYPLPLPTATPTITPTPGPTNTPVPTATPIPRAWVSDVAVDQNSNRVFIASPRDDAVQVIDGGPDDYIQPVPVGDGPTGLAVLTSTIPSKVFVVHEPDWTPGMWLVDANALTSHSMVDQGGYVGARPVKVAANSLTDRTYVSNYWDKLPVINALTENMVAFVQKKSFQASYGIRTSQSTNLVYMASIDTGELIIFDAVQAELNPNSYGACHNAPPDDDNNGDADPRNLRMVAVNPATGHVFVTSPPDLNTGQTDSRVYVLDEAVLLGPQGTNGQPPSDTTCLWNFLPNGQRSPTALPGKGWIKTIILPGSSVAGAGHIGIAANPATNKVYVTDGDANKVFVIQDGDSASLNLPVQVISTGFDNPQGVDANPLTNKVYVANARNTLAPYGTVTVLDSNTNAVLEIVPLTSTP